MNFTEQDQFPESGRMVMPGDSVIGGANAPINATLKVLFDRTYWLKNKVPGAAAVNKAGIVALSDVLTDGDANKALTAKMGKKLQDEKLGNSGHQTLNGIFNVRNNTWEALRKTLSDNSYWRIEFNPSPSVLGVNFNHTPVSGGGNTRIEFPPVAALSTETVAYRSWVNTALDGKLGSTGAQTIANGGLLLIEKSGWAGIKMKSGAGWWEIESNPASSDAVAGSVRMGFKFSEPGKADKGIIMPAIITGYETVAYQGWVSQQIAANQPAAVMLSGNQTVAGNKTYTGAAYFQSSVRVVNTSKNAYADIGCAASDVFLGNSKTSKYIQLKDTGELVYSGDPVLLRSMLESRPDVDNIVLPASAAAVKAAYDRANDARLIAQRAAPSGQIAFFAGNAAPTGWLKANGAAVSRASFAALFAAIGTTYGAGDGRTTFNLPDLRGEFVRGFDDGRNVDGGRAFGSAQGDAFQGHARNLKRADSESRMHGINYHQVVGVNSDRLSPAPAVVGEGDAWITKDYLAQDGYGTPRVAAETRPRNVAILACIKI